jgi:tetratricopeptide (TPR) repeat protein
MDSRCSIFWVNAATVARFEESFNQIATECGLITCEDTQADTALLVKEYLEDRHENPWLMVVDNVDDEDAFYGENMRNDKTPSQCIPHCRAGSLLFTTRTQSMALDLARPNAPITVDEMSPEEGLRLVRRRLQGDHSEDTILELINELDYVPLAITQSVSFIVKRRKTIPQYLDEYRRHDPAITELLSGEFSDHACQRSSIESVAKTWTILFQSIRDTKPRAAELLCLLSFLQHQAIPRQLLRREDEDKSYFEDAMALLVAFSLVDKDETGTMFSMHRLVQLATRRWLENESPKEVDIWALAALKSVSTHFPAPSHMPDNDWFRLCEALLPHAELALRFQFKSPGKETELEKAKLLLHSGRYISWNGAYAECQERFKKSLDIRLKYLGEKNVDTLKSMGMVVWQRSCWNDDPGNDPAIVLMARRLLTLRRELLGDDDPDTIDALSDLATSIATTGDLGQSEGLQREALRRSERVLGRKHCDTLNCMAHLASVLEDEGKKEEALKLQREAYDGKLELLGPGHRDLLVAECNLANLMLTDQKTKEEAIGVFMRNLKGKMKAFGPDHRETLITAMNLARALKNQGQFAAAHEICQHALDKSTPRKDIERTRTHLQKLDTNIKSWMLHVKESDSDRLILASFRSKL